MARLVEKMWIIDRKGDFFTFGRIPEPTVIDLEQGEDIPPATT
jgi:hypothetical protein